MLGNTLNDDVLKDLAASASTDVGRLLQASARSLTVAIWERAVASGHPEIRRSHSAIFDNLDADGTRISTLAARAGISRQAMGAMVREVEELGYLQSTPDERDGRATVVGLTPRGADFCHAAIDAATEVNREVDELLGRESANALRAQLHTLVAARRTRHASA